MGFYKDLEIFILLFKGAQLPSLHSHLDWKIQKRSQIRVTTKRNSN